MKALFWNSLDSDYVRQIVGPDLDQTVWHSIVERFFFCKKMIKTICLQKIIATCDSLDPVQTEQKKIAWPVSSLFDTLVALAKSACLVVFPVYEIVHNKEIVQWICYRTRVRYRKNMFFLLLNLNICCGYLNEPSQWGVSFKHPNIC